ncbi:SdrD B-like domain-containing protein [Roseibacillus persicicus]|uniref:SdrD B-like domain-containing protein n=1 Tax=Roseibacillus persicicus TaxID=454148 RepID=UPI00398AAFE0
MKPQIHPPFGKYFGLALIAWFILLQAALDAAPIVDNNEGTWTNTFNDELGTFSLSNVSVDVFAGTTSLDSGQAAGSQTSVVITPPSFDAWDKLCLDASYGSNDALDITLLDPNNGDAPIVGFVDLDLSNFDTEGCLDISGLDAAAYPEIRVRVDHKRGATAPVVREMTVTWNPQTVILFDKKTVETIPAGVQFPYQVRLSANFVNAQNVIVWDTLPMNGRGIAYPADYGQTDEPIIGQISEGGVFTADGTTDAATGDPLPSFPDGMTSFPVNSVVWYFDEIEAGNSLVLQLFVEAPNGTLNTTIYRNNANVHVDNGEDKVAEEVETVITSEPAPNMTKAGATLAAPGLTRVFGLNGENYVIARNSPGISDTLTFRIRDPFGPVDGNDYDEENRSRMYNTVIYDDLSGLIDPNGDGDTSDSYLLNPSNPAHSLSAIKFNADGTTTTIPATFTSTAVTVHTTEVPAQSVYWDFGTLEVGDGYQIEFKVDLASDIPQLTEFTNTAGLDSDQTELLSDELPMIVDVPIGGCFCKFGYFPHYLPKEQDVPCGLDIDGVVPVVAGDPVQYRLYNTNCGVIELNDVVYFDRIPAEVAFVSASLHNRRSKEDITTAEGATVWFYVGSDPAYDDPEVHPPFDYSVLPGTAPADWSQTQPATVTWVAVHHPSMPSFIDFPDDPGSRVYAAFNTTVSTPADPCDEFWIENWGLAKVYRKTDGTLQTLTEPFSYKNDDLTRVKPPQGEFFIDSEAAGVTPVTVIPGVAEYSLIVKNESADSGLVGLDAFSDVTVDLQLTPVNVNGIPTYPSIQGVDGGTITNFDPINGNVTLQLGRQLAPGEEATVAMELGFPNGTENLSVYTVNANLTGFDDLCSPFEASIQTSGIVSGTPLLQANKDDVLNVIGTGEEVTYEVNYRNVGTATSVNTWVVDRIPFRTTFVDGTAPNGEEVWFTDKLPPSMPANQISVLNPVDFSVISGNFTPGLLDDNGTPTDYSDDTWTSPFGDQTTWIAYKVDDPSLSPPQLDVSASYKTVTFTVVNDDNGTTVGTDGSPEGTVIFNELVIFSDTNLQAVGNEVRTTVESFPGLQISKSSNKDLVTAGERFRWNVDYINNSGFTDDIVTITDYLPKNVDLRRIRHEWNDIAVSNGQVAGEIDIKTDPNVTITNNADGSKTVEVRIAGSPGLKDDLLTGEGGRLTFIVRSLSTVASGTESINTVQGFASNERSSVVVSDSDPVTIANPDLTLSKIASTTEPKDGDLITFTLLVANRGLNEANDVVITDTLPTGMSFVEGSTQMLTPGYAILDDPTGGDSVLTWTSLTQDGGAMGVLPGQSADVFISYQVQVTGAAGDTLTNVAEVTTSDVEDSNYDNSDEQEVVLPFPDPKITKSAVSVAQAGETVVWTISYSNGTNNDAPDVTIIDAIPSGLSFNSVLLPAGVTAYYTDAPSAPTFTPGTSGAGWSTSPPATVTFIAFEVGTVPANAGDTDILVSTTIPGGTAPGTAYINTATISTSAQESDDPEDPGDGPDNNVATATTQIPGVDMAIAKSASAEGSVPGLRPGDPITYTIEVTNTGTQTAYGVKVEDVLPANFVPHPTAFNGFATVEATDDDGASVTLEDGVGAPVTFPVSATLDTLSPAGGDTVTWYFGTTANTGDADYYRNIGVPVGAIITFTYQGFVSETAADGETVNNATTLIVDNQSDSDPAEDFLSNNSDDVSTRVYRPELSIAKSVVNDSDQDETWTESGETLTYSIEYNNTGNADADDVVISEIIPAGTSYVPGSLELPAGAGVVWSPNADEPESFEVQFDTLPAPATFDGIPGYGTGTEVDPFTDLVALGGVPTGTYWFRIGGLSFQGYVDGDTAGGGWLMILNYVHQGGTNPELEVRSTNLPLLSSNALGDDESGSENWGHVSNSLAAALDFDTLRFYGETSAHSRLVHFRTTDDFKVGTSYVQTGAGNFNTLHADGTWLAIPGHSGIGPALSTSELSNQGDNALTALPFYDNGEANWAIRHNGDDWEVDEVVGDASEDTIHRVFVRKEPLGSAGAVLCLESRPIVEVESYLSEVSSVDAGYDTHVSFDTDRDNDGAGGTDDPGHTKAQQSTYHAIGDVNGDGVVDYIVGSPYRDLDEANEQDLDNVNLGSVIVNLMNADGTVASAVELGRGTSAANGHLSNLAAFDLFGFSVEPIGDADGDGVPDVAVGSYGTNLLNTNRGSVTFLYLNNDGTLKGTSQIVSGSAGFVTVNGLTPADNDISQGLGRSLTYIEDFAGSGESVLVSGDVNLDGSGETNSGGYYMMWLERDGSGNLTGNVTKFIKMQDGRDPSLDGVLQTSDLFGYDVEFVGDIDGNGAEDLLVGASGDDDGGTNRGAAYLLLLETSGEISDVVKYSSTSSSSLALDDADNLGYGVAVIGDLDGDGINEFAISAANDDDYSAGSGSSSNLGATYVIFPNADGSIREYQKLSPTENNGYLFLPGQNGGQRMNSYDVDDDGINELFYGTQTNGGVLYSTGTANPSYTYPGGVPTPTFGTVSKGTQVDDPGVVVVKLRGGTNAYATSVTEDFPISTNGTLTSWDKLLVSADADEAVTITYEILDSSGSSSLFGPDELEDGFADISDIDISNTDMILRVTMTSTDATATACLNSWRATYVVEEVPSFSFQVVVDDPAPAGQSTVDNTISIATSTPEIDDNLANNTAEDSINLRLTDLVVAKVVDTGAVKESAGETINYTVAWEVLGPQGAINTVVTDVLPANTVYVAASGSPTVDNNYQGSGLTALIWSLGDQPTGASGSFTVQVTESGGVAGDSLNNVVTIENERQETDYDNNDASALTVITDANGLANVWIEKVADTEVVDLYGSGSFTITYGNNGNGDAENVVISDTLPAGLVIQSVSPGTLGSSNDFSYSAGTLIPGETGSITVTFAVDQAYMTSNWGETQVNIANISTSSTETDLGDNSDPAEVDVILEQLASLSGKVYHDDDRADGDAGADNLGNLDVTEAGIPGVTITLTGTDIFGNSVELTTVTDENGDYSFAGINPGTYDVIETQPAGWFSTTTDSGDVIDTSASPSSTTADQGMAGSDTITGITLAGGERGVDFNFGEDLASLGDTVWIDGNGDGLQDAGEAGVPGVTVRVYDAATEAVVGVTTTDAQGNYLFDDLLAGDYYVEFDYATLPFGYGPTAQNVDGDDSGGDTNTDSDADVVTGRTQTVTLAAGDSDTDLDLGLIGPPVGTIGNYIWHDEDSNGYQDDGEPGLANVKVDLYDGDGNVVATTYTDADGGYLFTELPAGEYYVNVDETTLPNGFTQSPLTNMGGDFGNQDDSDNPGAGDYGYPVLLGGTEPMDNSTADFGYNINPAGEVNDPTATVGAEVAALGDFIWIDADGDGIQDDGEAPVAGVEVTLYGDADGNGIYDTVVATATTDSNGRYYFDGLVPDAYVVEVTDSATASHDILGADYTQTGDPDHFATTDPSPAANDNSSQPIVLAPGDVFLNADFGYQPEGTAPLGSIGDVVWNDLDGDGSEDAGEPGIGGVTVSLIDDLDGDGVWDVGEPIINTTTTASDGSYLFDNLPYDDYIVWVNDTEGVLSGLEQTHDADGVAGTPNQSATTIDSGTPDVTDQDFGYTTGEALGSIGDTIWGDLDNSGGDQSSQGNEPGLADVTVNLYADDDGDGLADDVNGDGSVDAADIIATTVTDLNGNYLFDGLPLGGYVVEVDTSSLPAGYQTTATHDSDGNNDSSSPVLLTEATPDNRAQDFSYPTDGTLGAIGDTIWADDDGNGSQNSGEQGIPGVTVELYDASGSTLIATTVTDSNGNYLFPNLPFDDYTVVVDTATLPEGYDVNPSGDPENDGDSSSAVTVDGGAPVNLAQDFGYPPATPGAPVGSIGDTIYADLDGNGTQDTNEPGLVGVTVTLTDGSETWTTVTDENGNYHFPNLDPDPAISYTVQVDTSTLPPEYHPVPTESGSDGGTDDSSTLSLDVTDASTRNNDAQDFGFQPAAETGSIGNYVWLDADGAGDQNETNTGIPGVVVELYDENGELIAVTETGPDGSYYFGGLPLDDGSGAAGADYTVKIADSNFDSGGVLQDLDNTFDNDGGSDSVSVVTLTSATPDNVDQDFGYVSTDNGSIGTTIWNDVNGDGILDGGESGIEGVTVVLYRDVDGDGVVDPSDAPIGTMTTDASGEYLFEGLPLGDYIVVVTDENNVLDGYWHSEGPSPGTDGNSQVDSGYPVTIDSADPDNDTADFGYYKDPAAVGNYVWLDADGDGVQESGESPIQGAVVTLTITYPDGTEVSVTDITDENGHYSFGNLLLDEDYNTGGGGTQPTYELAVQTPTDTEPTVVGSGDATSLTDSNDPAGTPAIPVQGETGTDQQVDPSSEPAVAGYDFGFTSPKDNTYAGWQDTWDAELDHTSDPGTSDGPSGNPDGDMYNNALEYALCLNPGSGLPGHGEFCLTKDPATGVVSAQFMRRRGGLLDVTYTLQGADTLGTPTVWSDLTSISPVVNTTDADVPAEAEKVTYTNLQNATELANGTASGIVRLCVEIDGTSYYTEAFGWQCVGYNDYECATFSNPFSEKPTFSGTFAATGALSLSTDLDGNVTFDVGDSAGGADLSSVAGSNGSHYLQITSGPLEGERFDILSGGVDSITLVYDPDIFSESDGVDSLSTSSELPADAFLNGESYQIIRYQTVADLFDLDSTYAGLETGDPNQATRLLFYNSRLETPTFEILMLIDSTPDPVWTRSLVTVDDDGDYRIDPAMGNWIHPKASGDALNPGSPVEQISYGMIASHDQAVALNEGFNLAGAMWPFDQKPAGSNGRNYTVLAGFDGGIDPLQSSELLFWNGDAVVDVNGASYSEGYDNYMLLDGGGMQNWVDINDIFLADQDELLILESHRSVMLKLLQGDEKEPHIYTLPNFQLDN